MEKHQLFDFSPKKLSHTWCNGRQGKDMVAKTLYRFLIYEDLIDIPFFFKSHVELGEISDHMPIVLEVTKFGTRSPTPMKFKKEWLIEEDYKKLVMESWSPLE
jgi:hypothetical protein